MTLRIAKQRYALLVAAFVATLAIAMTASSAAQAGIFEFKNLPGNTWSCGHCTVEGIHFEDAEASSASSICVGPVTYNGSWHAPYGWTCKGGQVSWEFAGLSAAAAAYNPNSGTFSWVTLLWS
jgi:hypothetical protein